MKIAITGGAGFIGSHVAKAYLDAGHDVLIIDTFAEGNNKNNRRWVEDSRARFYSLDIRDERLFTLFYNERPDVVSHHVGSVGREAYAYAHQSLLDADVHVRGLLNVLESCVAASVQHVIFASGGNTLYGCAGMASRGERTEQSAVTTVTEDTALCPRAPQDISSVAGEWYVRYYAGNGGMRHTILRYADVYGETRSDCVRHPLDYFASTLLAGRSPIIRGAIDEVHDHICIDDVVRANLAVLERGYNQTLHISSGEGYSVRELYQAVADMLGSDIEPAYISTGLIQPASIVMDNTRTRTMLRWQPEISLTEGIRRAIERRERFPEVEMIAPTLVGAR